MKFEKSCGAVVFDNDKVLLVTHLAGHTDFPKGHMEKGETEQETAIREVMEETNIKIRLTPFRHVVHYSPKPNVEKEVVFFLAYKEEGTILPQEKEIAQAMWVSQEEVENLLTFDTAKETFRKMVQEKTANQ